MSIRLSVHRPELTMPVLTESSQRPACMPGSKDECFLPRISQRGSCSDSDSVVECRRGAIARVPPSAATSVSSSPVKLPAISGKAKSNSVSSLSNGMSPTRREDQRSNLCRSPSCPSNLGFWYDRDADETETPTPVDNGYSYPVSQISKRDSGDLKLPNIKDRNSMCSGASQITVRSLATQRSPTKFNRDISPHTCRRDTSVSLSLNRDVTKDIPTPRAENVLDSQRSNTQSALLLPIRNSESRLSLKGKKKKKKKQGSRQNTDVSINSENTVVGSGASENFEQMKTKMEAIDARGYFSDAEESGMGDERFITKVKEENHVSKGKEGVVKVNKRHKLKKRMTDNNLYFERELTQVNA